MNSVTIFSSLFFAAACLFRVGYSEVDLGKTIEIVNDDRVFKTSLLINDKKDFVSIFYFGSETDSEFVRSLAKSHPNAQFILVNTADCETTKEDFHIEKLPTILLRRNGRHLAMYINPNWNQLDEDIKKYVNMPTKKEEIGDPKITDYKQFKAALAAADLNNDKLIVIYIAKDDIDHYFDKLINDYNNQFVMFKIDPDISEEVKEEFSHRAQFVKDSSPKILLRKFKMNVYRFFGFEQNQFDTIFKDCLNVTKFQFRGRSFRVSIFTRSGYSINAVQNPEEYQQLKTLIAEAEFDKKVILIYIVKDNNFSEDDSSVDELAKLHPTTLVIKVDVTKCGEVLTNYADTINGETEIKKFPTFIVRAFKNNKSRFNNYSYGDISYAISKYSYGVKDPDLPENQPKWPIGRLMVAAYPYYNRAKNLMIAQLMLR